MAGAEGRRGRQQEKLAGWWDSPFNPTEVLFATIKWQRGPFKLEIKHLTF